MRKGFTTGSAATAAAAAAARMLITGEICSVVCITTPAGIDYEPVVEDPHMEADRVTCAIRKDGGDDPDITHGTLIYAEVSRGINVEDRCPEEKTDEDRAAHIEQVHVDGGEGIGKVTRPGLDMPIGEYAINSTPRKMIKKAVHDVCMIYGYTEPLSVKIFIPDGTELARKTFNGHLGIVGGISVIGTTGIVNPMSKQALIDTIKVDIRMQAAEKMPIAVIAPGNYGITFLNGTYGLDKGKIVECSNFIGVGIDLAIEMGFDRILMAGHTGKFVKVAGGIMNTHSNEADSRMEIFLACATRAAIALEEETKDSDKPIKAGEIFPIETQKKLLDCITTTAVLELLDEIGLLKKSCEIMVQKVKKSLEYRAKGNATVECFLYENTFGELARTEHAMDYLSEVL